MEKIEKSIRTYGFSPFSGKSSPSGVKVQLETQTHVLKGEIGKRVNLGLQLPKTNPVIKIDGGND